MGNCFNILLTDCARGYKYPSYENQEEVATMVMGPDKQPAAELCPFCKEVVRNARQIWLDELEEEVMNERCVSRMVEADEKRRAQNQKYLTDCGHEYDKKYEKPIRSPYRKSPKIHMGPHGDSA